MEEKTLEEKLLTLVGTYYEPGKGLNSFTHFILLKLYQSPDNPYFMHIISVVEIG